MDTAAPLVETGADTADAQDAADASHDAADSARADGASDASTVPDVKTDTSTPPDSGLPAAASLWASPTLPAFDAATVAHVRQVRTTGQTKGNRLNVVGKFGDSITVSQSFFYDIGNGSYTLGSYSALATTITAIRGVTLSDGKNSFNHDSLAARGGWKAGDALLGNPSAVEAEVAAIRPGYAIVMFGTNDGNATTFATNMNQIVDQLEGEGTVAVVSTIPDRTDYGGSEDVVRAMNVQVRNITAQRHLPLIDLFVGLASLPNSGLSSDEVHPSVRAAGTSGEFTEAGLQYGYNFRNLTALQMLDRLRALPQ